MDDDDWLYSRDGDMTPPKGVLTTIHGGANNPRYLEAGKPGPPSVSVNTLGEEGVGASRQQAAGITMTVDLEQTFEK